MKITHPDSPHRFDNKSTIEMKEIVDKSVEARTGNAVAKAKWVKKQSENTTLQHFRNKHTDISVLMEHYKTGDQVQAIAKYMEDNERFVALYNGAEDNKDKADILSKYMSFQLRMHELMFGTKTKNMNLNVSVDGAKSMNAIYNKCQEENKRRKEESR